MLKDKNTLFGIALIALTTLLFFFYLKNRPAVVAPPTEALSSKDSAHAPIQADAITTTAVQTATIADTARSSNAGWVANQGNEEKLTMVENSLMKVYFSNKGGRISKIELKEHESYKETKVILFDQANSKFGFNLGDANTQDLIFDQEGNATVIKDKDLATIKFHVHKGNETFQQVYTLTGNSYLIDYKIAHNGGTAKNLTINWSEVVKQQEADVTRERMYSSIYYLDPNEKNIQYLSLSETEEKNVDKGFRWISFKQQFFNSLLIAKNGFKQGKMKSYFMKDDTAYVKKYSTELQIEGNTADLQFYIGPNSYNLLKKLDFGGEKLIPLSPDFVLMRWTKVFNEYFIIPLFNFLSQFFSNYGIIILIMTLFIKTLLLPLSYKTFKLGVATKVLQPELNEIRKKYGDDQQKFAQEQMKVMSAAGVSQMSGCLPALLQVPLLIAMVNFFPASIELRHESFLWAKDLSTFDSIGTLPFNIPLFGNHISLFTILMTITQIGMTWYMQKNQPSSPMADQMKYMTYFMPVMLMFMFNGFPAAMTYYYLLQNVISMAQQFLVTKYFISEEAVRAEIEAHKKTPKKKSAFQQKMDDIMAQAEEAKKVQQNSKKK